MSRIVPLVLAGLLVAGCSLLPAPTENPAIQPLTIENDTTLDLVVLVNGHEFPIPRGTSGQLGGGALGPRPWAVEARTAATARFIGSLVVDPDAGTCTQDADGSRSCTGAAEIVDLSCGRLLLYVGVPSFPAPPGNAGHPGDCEP